MTQSLSKELKLHAIFFPSVSGQSEKQIEEHWRATNVRSLQYKVYVECDRLLGLVTSAEAFLRDCAAAGVSPGSISDHVKQEDIAPLRDRGDLIQQAWTIVSGTKKMPPAIVDAILVKHQLDRLRESSIAKIVHGAAAKTKTVDRALKATISDLRAGIKSGDAGNVDALKSLTEVQREKTAEAVERRDILLGQYERISQKVILQSQIRASSDPDEKIKLGSEIAKLEAGPPTKPKRALTTQARIQQKRKLQAALRQAANNPDEMLRIAREGA